MEIKTDDHTMDQEIKTYYQLLNKIGDTYIFLPRKPYLLEVTKQANNEKFIAYNSSGSDYRSRKENPIVNIYFKKPGYPENYCSKRMFFLQLSNGYSKGH